MSLFTRSRGADTAQRGHEDSASISVFNSCNSINTRKGQPPFWVINEQLTIEILQSATILFYIYIFYKHEYTPVIGSGALDIATLLQIGVTANTGAGGAQVPARSKFCWSW